MSNTNQTLTGGNYLRIVVGLNQSFCAGHSLIVRFFQGSTIQREDLLRERVVYVLCKARDLATKLKSEIGSSFREDSKVPKSNFVIGEEYGIIKVIDPDTLINLGGSVEFSTSETEGYGLSIKASFINPPEWVPINNDNCLRMQGKGGALEIRVIDRKLGEIVYGSGSIEIAGSDLRVYGDAVRFDNGNVIKTGSKPKWEGLLPICRRVIQIGLKKVAIFFRGEKEADVDQPPKVPEVEHREAAVKENGAETAAQPVPTVTGSSATGGEGRPDQPPKAIATSQERGKNAESVPRPSSEKVGKMPASAKGRSGTPCQLEIKGNGITVKDVRTSDVEMVIVRSMERIRTEVVPTQQDNEKNHDTISLYDWPGWLVILLIIEILIVALLTALPLWKFLPVRDKYLEVLEGGRMTNEVVMTGSVYSPSVITNTLSMQTSCKNAILQNAPTNTFDATATSVSSMSGAPPMQETGRNRVFGVTLYFVLACSFYVVFYLLFVCFIFRTLHTLRRKRKLTADMSSVIKALRNERDKEKRRAMQKKILDDIIDTYLDRPSSSED